MHTGACEQLQQPLVSIQMSLRVIQDGKIALQISGAKRGFRSERIVSPKQTTSRSRRNSSMRNSGCRKGNVTKAASTVPDATSSAR
jgi:hypothetical protein